MFIVIQQQLLEIKNLKHTLVYKNFKYSAELGEKIGIQ